MDKMTDEQLLRLFRANLKAIREEAGMSQSELARRIDRRPAYICDLERGRWNPNLQTLAPLAEALGVAPASLISVTHQPDSEFSENLLSHA
jgi:transcriptional regulator with XRE-family HTH domain